MKNEITFEIYLQSWEETIYKINFQKNVAGYISVSEIITFKGKLAGLKIDLTKTFDELSREEQELVNYETWHFLINTCNFSMENIKYKDLVNKFFNENEVYSAFSNQILRLLTGQPLSQKSEEHLNWVLEKIGISYPICTKIKNKNTLELQLFTSPFEVQILKVKNKKEVTTTTFESKKSERVLKDFTNLLLGREVYDFIPYENFTTLYEAYYESVKVGSDCLNWKGSFNNSQNQLQQC